MGLEAAGKRYDCYDVLRISERHELVYDATTRGFEIPSHCSDYTVTSATADAIAVWLGNQKKIF